AVGGGREGVGDRAAPSGDGALALAQLDVARRRPPGGAADLKAAHVAVGHEAGLLDASAQGPQLPDVAQVPRPSRDGGASAPAAAREQARHEVDDGRQQGLGDDAQEVETAVVLEDGTHAIARLEDGLILTGDRSELLDVEV